MLRYSLAIAMLLTCSTASVRADDEPERYSVKVSLSMKNAGGGTMRIESQLRSDSAQQVDASLCQINGQQLWLKLVPRDEFPGQYAGEVQFRENNQVTGALKIFAMDEQTTQLYAKDDSGAVLQADVLVTREEIVYSRRIRLMQGR
jgi:hypothetical protein